VRPTADLAQARSPRSGERSPLAQARDSRLGEIATEALGGFIRLLRQALPHLNETTPRPKVRFLTWTKSAATCKAPTRSRLGERLSLEQDVTSLK